MQRAMLAFDGLLRRRRRLVLAVWVAALLVAAPFAAFQSEHLTGGGFEAPGSQADVVERALAREFPSVEEAVIAAVLVPRADARPDDLRRAVAEVAGEVVRVDGVALPPQARRAADARAASRPREPVVIQLSLSGGEQEAIDAGRELRAEVGVDEKEPGSAAGGSVDVHVAGQGALWAALQEVTQSDVRTAEARAFPLTAIILLAAFGSLAAAALPLGLGFAAVTITGALIYALSLATSVSVYVTNMASLVGIGVAVDYSLFVLARYREEVRAGRTPAQARAAALATSGVAVIFSGVTFIASVAGLLLIDSTALRSMAAGAMIVVAVSMLAAAALLPVLISLLGDRVHEPGRLGRWRERRRARRPQRPPEDGFWHRWTRTVMRRPVVSVLAASAFLLTLAIPALDLEMGNSGLRQLDDDHELRDGLRAAGQVVGPGAVGPVRVLVDPASGSIGDGASQAAIERVRAALARDPGVARVEEPVPSDDAERALVTAVLRSDPESQAAREAVPRLRAVTARAAGDAATVHVGGTTATIVDFDDLVSSSMWKLMLFLVVLGFALLVVMLRSVLLPIKAVLMTLLSVAAAYGVLVAVFQWGWLEFLGLEAAPFVDTLTPPLVLVVAFGLSMDYEVFLLTRIRERYAETGDNRRAVAEGLASSAHTITSAALVMIGVYIAFVTAGLPAVQRLGLASAVAIAVDATIVRLVLVPATMELLGRWNWWLPAPLARVLPHTDIESLRTDLLPDGDVQAAREAGSAPAGAR